MTQATITFTAVVERRESWCDWCDTGDVACFQGRNGSEADICDSCVAALAAYLESRKRIKEIKESTADGLADEKILVDVPAGTDLFFRNGLKDEYFTTQTRTFDSF